MSLSWIRFERARRISAALALFATAGARSPDTPITRPDAISPQMVKTPAPGSKDSALVALAAALLDAEPAVGALWPDGWSFAPCLIFIDEPGRSASVLITSGPAPRDFIPLPRRDGRPAEEIDRPPLRAYLYSGPLPGLNGTLNLRYPLGDRIVLAIPWKGSAPVTASLLIHEAFHLVQRERFDDRGDSPILTEGLTGSPRFRALTEIERRVLIAALRSHSREEIAERARELLAVRRERYGATDAPTIARADRLHERIEGSAEWIGREGARIALGGSRDSAERALIDEWLRPPLDHPSVPIPDRLVRTRAYGTGSAIAIILERLGAGWQRPLERGVALDAQLAEAVGARAPRASLQNILAAHGYDDAYRAAETMTGAPSADAALASFTSSGSERVVIELFRAPMLSVKAEAMLKPAEKLLLFMPALRFTFIDGATQLTVQEHPVSVDDRPTPMRITVLVDQLPLRIAGGAALRADPEGAVGPVSLRVPGFEFSAARATLRHVSEDSIVVRVPR
jgi:hypothetical protein